MNRDERMLFVKRMGSFIKRRENEERNAFYQESLSSVGGVTPEMI